MRTVRTNPRVVIYSSDALVDETDMNVDVEVMLGDDTRWSATVFTVANLRALLQKDRRTGEDCRGFYYWCPDMVVVETLSDQGILDLVDEATSNGELTKMFVRLDDEPDTDTPPSALAERKAREVL
jgi:hypothetical protein